MKTGAVILAAGDGKRMKSEKIKTLHEVLFKPMIDWVLDAARRAGVEKPCVVVGSRREQLEEHFGGEVETVFQRERLGTGNALLAAEEYIRSLAGGDVVVLCGDAPFFDAATVAGAMKAHRAGKNDVTVVTARLQNPFGYGRIVRGEDGRVQRSVEEKDADAETRKTNEINSGTYCFKADVLPELLRGLRNDNAQGEYYLTDTVALANDRGLRVGAFEAPDPDVVLAANDRAQLLFLNQVARKRILARLMENGVSLIDDSGVLVGPDVEVGADTLLLPGTILRGRTKIGRGCVVGPNSLLEDCTMGDNVVFNASQAYRSTIENGVTVGPYVHIRPNTVLREKVHVGDFVEIKNSDVGAGSKLPHLSYVGDSDVGERVNFGCGSITSNYDGVKKSRTVVEDDAFIGCNNNLVAPVRVGKRAFTAAGSTITRDVPDDALAVARSRQENIEGWVARKRPKKD